jgi:hypothetical protein
MRIPEHKTALHCSSSEVDILPTEPVPPSIGKRTRWIRATLSQIYRSSGRKYPWRRRIGIFRTLLTECLSLSASEPARDGRVRTGHFCG